MFKQTAIAAAIAALPLSVCYANSGPDLTPVPTANPKASGIVAQTILSPELMQVVRAAGANPVENPNPGVITHYGYANAGASTPLKPMIPLSANVEAQKTEPDKNTYLILDDQSGPDAAYDYGKHFVFQGHELGVDDGTGHQMGAITRINLDADAAHRITVLATTDTDGKSLPVIDGSTWYPFSDHLLFSQEGNGTSNGGVWQATADFPSTVENVAGIGRGGFEGMQADRDGNVWIVEDIGGVKSPSGSNAKIPNSFVYRFVPYNRHNLLAGGKLFALQVMSKANPGKPINFQTAIDTGTALTPDMQDLHTYNNVFETTWVMVHDTAAPNGLMPFNANDLAKSAKATPFKRPENGQFRPGSEFREFFFDETGDTDATSTADASYGGWGAVLKLTQAGPSAMSGKLRRSSLATRFTPDSTTSGSGMPLTWCSSRMPVICCTGNATRSTRPGCSTFALTTRKRRTSRFESSRRDATRPRRSTPRSHLQVMKVTTRSPVSTCRTATPASGVCWAPAYRIRSTTAGACFTQANTAKTTHMRSCRMKSHGMRSRGTWIRSGDRCSVS